MTEHGQHAPFPPAPVEPPATLLLEPLLSVHSATDVRWLADAAGIAAERGMGALHGLLYLLDASGQLVGQRPASSERARRLVKVHHALNTDLTTIKFAPQGRPATASALRDSRTLAVLDLNEVIPLAPPSTELHSGQRQLGIGEVWLAPVRWGGESMGLLVLLMPSEPPASLVEAELLGRHIAVALCNLRQQEEGRRRGELDATRWVYDERRFLEQLSAEIRRAQRHGRPLSVMLLRLANLEELRVRYGRFLTEQVLRQLGHRFTDTIRDTDFLGAYQVDGFASILVEADREGAQRAKERLMTGVQKIKLPEADLPDLDLRLACATATLQEDGETAEELTAAAEARLGQETPAREDVA